MKCERCEKVLADEDYIYAINLYVWCEKCYTKYILPEIKMTARDYINRCRSFAEN